VAFGFFCQKTEEVLSFSFMTSTHPVCFAATPPFQGGECPPRLLRSHPSLAGLGLIFIVILFCFVCVPSPSNNFELKVCFLFKGKVAFGFFCQKTEGVLSFSFITSTHPVCFAATPPFQGGEYPSRLLRSHPSLAGWGAHTFLKDF